MCGRGGSTSSCGHVEEGVFVFDVNSGGGAGRYIQTDVGDGGRLRRHEKKGNSDVSVQMSTSVVFETENERECNHRHWSINFQRTPRR